MTYSNLYRETLIRISICTLIIISSADIWADNHALLIGIQNYPKTKDFNSRAFDQLSGPLNDISLMEEMLTTPPFVFPKKNITVLLDDKATHSGIEKAFLDLKQRVKPGDFVYIHYSGHGSEALNDNPDVDKEINIKNGKSMDETWVPYGASAGKYPNSSKDDWDVRDDEIGLWLANLGTDHIVFVSDSCHSGSASRGPKIGVRGIPMDTRVWPKNKSIPSTPLIGIRIGASRDQQSSFETKQGDKSYGRFTWFWSKALTSAKPGETWGDVFHRTDVLMREESMDGTQQVYQSPQIEPQVLGKQDIKILGGDFKNNNRGVVVAAISDDGKEARLSSGMLSGINKGSIYRGFETDEAKAKSSAEAEITKVDPFSSTARIVSGKMKAGDLLVESQHAYSFEPVRIVVEGDAIKGKDKTLAQKVGKALNIDDFKVVNRRQDSDWIILIFHPEKKANEYIYNQETALPISKQVNPPEAWVLNAQEQLLDETLRVKLTDASKGIEEIVSKLKKVADMRDLIRLKNDPPKFAVWSHKLRPDDKCTEGDETCFILEKNQKFRQADTNDLATQDAIKVPLNSMLGFTVENKTDQDYYLYLLNVSMRDGANLIFPRRDTTAEAAIIQGGKKKKLPGAVLFANTGREIIKAIISKTQLDPMAFEFAGTEERDSRRGPTSPLERLLNRKARRAKYVPAPAPSEWGTVQADMLITSP